MKTSLFAVVLCAAALSVQGAAPGAKPAAPKPGMMRLPFYGDVKVVDEIDCTATDHRFEEYPAGASRVETVLEKPCRVLPVQDGRSSFLAWRLGEGKGVKPNGAYVVVIEFPDDQGRDYYVRNYGNNSRRSFYTGSAIGDACDAPIVGHHPESLQIPQTQKYQLWTALTFPGQSASTRRDDGKIDIATEGFDIAVAQYKKQHHPETAGVAVRRIVLCEIPDEKALWAKITLPPAPLPRRHIFWREEMSDFAMGKDNICPGNDGLDWLEQKLRTMKILGQNTYCKDLLEFGHNQHWDPDWKARNNIPGAKPAGRWMWASQGPEWDVWGRVVPLAVDKYGFDILPYYEYGGAAGDVGVGSLGPQKRAEPLNMDNKPDRQARGANYTHIWWSEGKLRVDITDPATFDELAYILDCTIFRFKDQVQKGGFVGAWFRPRPGQWAISFSDATRARFGKDANGGQTPTRADLQNNKALYDRYIQWWGGKRAEFLDKVRNYLEKNGVKDAATILENDASEPGYGLKGHDGVVTDDTARWQGLGKKAVDANDPALLSEHSYLEALKTPSGTWGPWEWQHANPGADPDHYQKLKNVWISMSFHNLFTVSDPGCFAAFRNANGTETIVRHYGLNEHVIEDKLLGYSMADWERAGRYCMIAEVNAMANGDPVNLGYLMGSQYTRGFPGPVQEFNRNFLALPALPSKKLDGAASDAETTVRLIDTGRTGKYFEVVHTGWTPKKDVKIRVPGGVAQLTDIDGHHYPVKKGVAVLPLLKPVQLLTLWTK